MFIAGSLSFVFWYNTNGVSAQKTPFVRLMRQTRIMYTFVPKSMQKGRISSINTIFIAVSPCFVFGYSSNGVSVQNTEFVRLIHQTRIVHTCVPKSIQKDRISKINTIFIAVSPCFVFGYKTNGVSVQNTQFVRLMHNTRIVHTCVPKWSRKGRTSSINTMFIAYTPCFVVQYNTNGFYVVNTVFVRQMHQTRIVHTCMPK